MLFRSSDLSVAGIWRSGSGVSPLSLPNRNRGAGISSGIVVPSLGPHWLLSTHSSSKIRRFSLIGAGRLTLMVPSGVASAIPHWIASKLNSTGIKLLSSSSA